jgi:hypothetical protein
MMMSRGLTLLARAWCLSLPVTACVQAVGMAVSWQLTAIQRCHKAVCRHVSCSKLL